MSVNVQTDDFDLGAEVSKMASDPSVGAIVSFTGIVRDAAHSGLISLELECYPSMVEQALQSIEKNACDRWDLRGCKIIHRIGNLKLGEQIMMVATASPHRQDAFDAAEFLMDYLKSEAPFWKKEHFKDHATWVDARETDLQSLQRWQD
ncbi:molybdenum cofactor biosynthesis protein MoaE [Amylibacter ulvae]|uniref:Molybdopterin synthase catalytic subunit n=1 Tax=Paramylibacter ulvae TaxID=1651968 RepID=A0ABQ3D6J0_9RHOB|nr:molybdenum cofactor biosynthesis protein MoaE [Amylibacter ulvae]GHA58054.1 molybdenum cofactor biosynthesis protein MoaE [Amylibacter ulvae]